MSLLIIGCDGFIGKEFLKTYPNSFATKKDELNLLKPTVADLPKTEFAIIAAGMGNPKRCEQDPKMSYQCNVKGTLQLCEMLLDRGTTPVVFSTDYVFDGKQDKYDENAVLCPLNVYGKQKAELELRASLLDCLIIRLSKVYGTKKHDKSLIDEMASHFMQENEVKAASDQIFAPIHVEDVVGSVMALLMKKCRGLYNLAGDEVLSRHKIAQKIATRMAKGHLLKEISLDDLEEAFKRPKSTVLACQKLKSVLDPKFKSLDEGIDMIVRNYEAN